MGAELPVAPAHWGFISAQRVSPQKKTASRVVLPDGSEWATYLSFAADLFGAGGALMRLMLAQKEWSLRWESVSMSPSSIVDGRSEKGRMQWCGPVNNILKMMITRPEGVDADL
jgi:hypothetical protein